MLFDEDRKLPGNIRLCPKLTRSHVNPDTFERMRVSLMTQVYISVIFSGHELNACASTLCSQ